jgi:geranylgeranyl transferase type-1 subunit beta
MDRQRQIAYFSYSLRQLPGAYGKLDTNRLTLAHFCVQALALLGVWDDDASVHQEAMRLDRQAIIDWIYSLQVPFSSSSDSDEAVTHNNAGFTGGRFLGSAFHAADDDDKDVDKGHPHAAFCHAHVAMTYTALCTLRTLGDDLSRVPRAAIVAALRPLQRPGDGSFYCIAAGSEHDLRFLYCACCICHMLGDWSGMDVERTLACLRACRNPCDGAFGLVPGQEGHGGSTFCAVASLVLLDRLHDVLDADARAALVQWCVGKQQADGGGLQGRPNKAQDTCYSYWIGGTLVLLGHADLLDHDQLSGFVLQCQSKLGGFSKVKGAYPDVLHAYYSLAYLSLSQDYRQDVTEADRLKPVNCTLGIAQDTAACFSPLFL